MPYYPELNLIFIHIPKTAGGSVERILKPFQVNQTKTLFRRLLARLGIRQNPLLADIPGHSTAALHRRVLGPEVFDKARRFAIVRNPYSRAISHYEFIRQNPRHHRHDKVKAQGFVDFLGSRELSQMPFLTGRDGRLLVDRILRFEELPGCVDALFAELGLDIVFPFGAKTNTSEKKAEDTYLTPEAIRLINRKCAQDFSVLGYAMLPAGG